MTAESAGIRGRTALNQDARASPSFFPQSGPAGGSLVGCSQTLSNRHSNVLPA